MATNPTLHTAGSNPASVYRMEDAEGVGYQALGLGPAVRIRNARGRSEWWAVRTMRLLPNGRTMFSGYRYQPNTRTVHGMRQRYIDARHVLEVRP